jgi:hypothetical protein
MRRRWARHRVIPVVGIAVVATTAVTILEVAPWASGATQFRHTASSPAFQRGSDQGLAVTVTNMASRAQERVVVIRGADGSKLNTLRVSIPAGHAQVEGFLAGDFSQFTNRVVVTSTSSSRSNPCVPLAEIISPSSGNHVDAVIANFAVKNTAA